MSEEIIISGAIMMGLASVFAVILALAYRYMRVEEDPRIDLIEEALPGSNCGACGYPGCRAFSEAVVGGGSAPGKCTVSSPDAIAAIADMLGVEAGVVEKRVARLHCAGGKGSVKELSEYKGINSCQAVSVVNSGGRACAWGCLGLADCEKSCQFEAIHITPNNLPVVNVDTCTACGDCVVACPLDLFDIQLLSQKLIVQCSSPLTGDEARSSCVVACDACGRCAADAAPDVIEMSGGLPVIKLPELTTQNSINRCPTGAIRWVDGEQFQTERNEPIRRRIHA